MFSLISSSLTASTSRFLTFELGRGDEDSLRRVFSTSLSIHLSLSIISFVLLESVGVWFLNAHLTIPGDRLSAANWVFHASVVAFVIGLFSVPYNSSITSHEHMTTFAYVGILDVCLRLAIVLFIAHCPWNFDRLIVYSLLLIAVAISLQVFYLYYCRKHFPECRLRFTFDRLCWKEMSSFAGWNFIGSIAGLVKDQGVNILLNLFIGPVLNAARGIAGSASSTMCVFANNFMTALTPQITKSYAAGDREYMMMLVERGSRFSFYIMALFALPILLETDFALSLWLGKYPDHSVCFLRLLLILALIDVLSRTLITLQNATGRIRNYQIAVGGVLILNFPLSYACLNMGLPPESTIIVAIVVAIFCLLLRLWFLRRMIGLSAKRYIKNVCFNVFVVLILSLFIPLLLHLNLQNGWSRFILVSLISVTSTAVAAYFVGCNQSERKFICQCVSSLKRKLFGY